MHFATTTSLLLTALTTLTTAIALPNPQSAHGDGAENEQGPVSFLWPHDRAWKDEDDNTGPCGSRQLANENRTDFPLMNGAVALTILDDAADVFLRISYKENPIAQSDFVSLSADIESLDAGHQCYNHFTIPRDVEAGDVATLQLEYRAEDDGKIVSHYACADITFVPNSQFTKSIPCFNVTSEEFVEKKDEESAAVGVRVQGVLMGAVMAARL
ncbi:hypothetical protein EX30DRAFT_398112 [Ascodesmis nigricans]|uniref:Copper acquisition factor BIM1-like domain-containing protein n=1 Tax=Ascodesmis nigricans TaxID=341454 RepID=A0A4S2MRT4_9PEZI|nr:hypothetical protein EX30DRAFT_398112 [Ascodesmis nigricans]